MSQRHASVQLSLDFAQAPIPRSYCRTQCKCLASLECTVQRFHRKTPCFRPCTKLISGYSWRKNKDLWNNLYAAPEGDIILNRVSRLLRRGIVPGGVLIGSIAYPDVVVTCDAFPRTGAMGFAWKKIFALDRIRRKIVIALDDNGLIGFGNDGIFPGRFHGAPSFDYGRLTGYAAELREHIRIMNLIPIAKARTNQFRSRGPGSALHDKMLTVEKIFGVIRIGAHVRSKTWERRKWSI